MAWTKPSDRLQHVNHAFIVMSATQLATTQSLPSCCNKAVLGHVPKLICIVHVLHLSIQTALGNPHILAVLLSYCVVLSHFILSPALMWFFCSVD